MTAKQFYTNYLADDNLSLLSYQLKESILRNKTINHVLEFGCGTGKHLNVFNRIGIPTIGIDISIQNILKAKFKYDLPCLINSDETYLRNFSNIDIVFTCSVLDHIPDISGIIEEFKRMANKEIFLAETNSIPNDFYYPHDYEKYGFEKIKGIQSSEETNSGVIYTEDTGAFAWQSPSDGALYHIWKWTKK